MDGKLVGEVHTVSHKHTQTHGKVINVMHPAPSIGRAEGRKTSIIQIHTTHTHTDVRLTALCPGLPGWAGTRKVVPIWILLKQETVSGSGISWSKSASRSRQITTSAPHRSVFTGRMPFMPPNQQCQSTEGIIQGQCKLHN